MVCRCVKECVSKGVLLGSVSVRELGRERVFLCVCE